MNHLFVISSKPMKSYTFCFHNCPVVSIIYSSFTESEFSFCHNMETLRWVLTVVLVLQSSSISHTGVVKQFKLGGDGKARRLQIDLGVNGPGLVNPPVVAVVTQSPIDVAVGGNGNTGTGNTGATSVTSSGVRNVESGSIIQMRGGNVVRVSSTNFNLTNYPNNEVSIWKFEANQCTLSTYCPCVDIPRSWECLGDYLKIGADYVLQNQRFCGGNKPGQPIYSDSDFLSIRFRSDGRTTASGFTCIIRCEGPGQTILPITDIICPTTFATGVVG